MGKSKQPTSSSAFKGYVNISLGTKLAKDAQSTVEANLDGAGQANWIANALYDFAKNGVTFKLAVDADGDYVCTINATAGAWAGYYVSSVQPTLFEAIVITVYKWVQTARMSDDTFATYAGKGSKYR